MQNKTIGTMAAGVISAFLSGQYASASSAKPAGNSKPSDAGQCVHSCAGHASCAGNGSNSCKGQNTCANQGNVPDACKNAKTEEACKVVKDSKNTPMCAWVK